MEKITLRTLAETLFLLFQGRLSAYAIKILKPDGTKMFMTARDDTGSDLGFTQEVCEKHLKGEIAVGVYPVNEDNLVKWAAVDFDGKIKNTILEDSLKIKKELQNQLGIISWLEISQSGNGIHLWVFFKDWVSARKVRIALRKVIPEWDVPKHLRTTSFDRVFPNQDFVGLEGYGNLCAIPLNGPELVSSNRTVFIDDLGRPLENQSEALIQILNTINLPEVILSIPDDNGNESRIKERPEGQIAGVSGGGKLLSDVGCRWLLDAYSRSTTLSEPEWWAAINQFAQVKNGEKLAHYFSKDYPTYSAAETQKLFNNAVKQNKPQTIDYIQKNFGGCPGGCRCKELGLRFPWEIAKVPISVLIEKTVPKIYTSQELSTIAVDIVKEIASGKRLGYPWGYDTLDDATELRPGDLVVVAARRSLGKTGFAIAASVNGAKIGIPQYFISMEMTVEQIALRYLANLSKIDHEILVTGQVGEEDWNLVKQASEEFGKLPLFVDDRTNDLDKMFDNLAELIYLHGPGPVWVDYLQLVRKQNHESKKDAVDRVIAGYKNIAKILKVPVITLAQLNRQEETYEGDDELDSWLKDSGDIEQTADVILYMRGRRTPGIAIRKIILHKERHRAAGKKFKFEFNQGIYQFKPWGVWTIRDEENSNMEFELKNGYDSIEEN